jgi:hypothetical protein
MRFTAAPLMLSFLLPVSLLPAVAAQAQATLAPGTAHYDVYQGDKTVGKSDYTVQSASNGYTVTSHGELKLTKFNYSFTNTQKLDANLNLVSNQLNGTVNGTPVTFAATADSSGRQFQIQISANGKQTQNTVDRHQHLVLLADLDAAAYTLLTQMVIQNPPTSWILIPKENGLLVPSTIFKGSSVRGRLNGTQIDVQHATVAVSAENSIDVELFYTTSGQLLEADLTQQNFFVVLDGFKLIDRPKSAAPAPPPPSNSQQGSPQQGNGNGAPQYPAPQGGVPQPQQQ